MPISLTAEQKSISKIFSGDEEYVIPSYQRSYSWEFDECYQLYTDLTDSFDRKEGYFLGNIVLAKSNNSDETNILQIIDGQQRCISLWLIIKVLSVLQPDIVKLKRLLGIESWTGESWTPKIRSKIIESQDSDDLEFIYNLNRKDLEDKLEKVVNSKGEINEKKINSKLLTNCLYFFSWFSKLQQTDKNYVTNFIKYLLENVFLLPIELQGDNMESSVNQALSIFETINNRGRDLEDADIFKSMLYNDATKVNKQKEFIDLWADMKERTDTLKLSIDDIFRFYSHIIRAEQGIVSNEKKLRHFFTEEKFSPLKVSSYDSVLVRLNKILDALDFYQSIKESNKELGKWIQIIDAYTNAYPKYAIITYLVLNNHDDRNNLIQFCKSLIRYIYFKGSTTTIKFEIYQIIHQIAKKEQINEYMWDNIGSDYFESLGRLKKGIALIAYYMQENTLCIPFYKLDKIVTAKNSFLSSPMWLKFDLESLANLVISDLSTKNLTIEDKKEYFRKSIVNNQLLDNVNVESAESLMHFLINREEVLRNNIKVFFSKSLYDNA